MDALVKQLGALRYRDPGIVLGLVEKVAVGIHASRDQVSVIVGNGFSGDHDRKDFWKGKRVTAREVTAFSSEVSRLLGIDPVVIGDNLITQGIDLSVLKAGDELRIGSIVLRRAEKDHRPCEKFARRASHKAMLAVRESGTRGALFHVWRGGTMRVGDPIEIVRK